MAPNLKVTFWYMQTIYQVSFFITECTKKVLSSSTNSGKSSSRNWKQSIHYGGKPLLNCIESYSVQYKSPDGKKRCHFVSAGRRFVSPDSSVVIPPSQQDDTIGRVGITAFHLTSVSTTDNVSKDQSL